MGKLVVQALTDVGQKRDHNEDYFGHREDLGIFVVCDGMGGHASGEVASRMTVEHILEFVEEHYDASAESMPYGMREGATDDETLLSNALQYANDRVYVEGMKDAKLEGMGTTVVAMLAKDDVLVCAHVGDSRIYGFSAAERLRQVTRDHSLLNHKIDKGELKTADEIANFRQGNIIVRAIGLKDYVSPEVQTVPRRPNELFLLCSDGLTDLVDDWLIENVLEANYDALEEGAQALVNMANDRGGKDNITVMFVRVDDTPPAVDGVSDEVDEVTDPHGIASVEELTDPGLVADEEVDAADVSEVTDAPRESPPRELEIARTDPALDVFGVTSPAGMAFEDTEPVLPAAPQPEPQPAPQPKPPVVEVQSGAVTVRKRKEHRQKPAQEGPSVIIGFDDDDPDLPSFIINLED